MVQRKVSNHLGIQADHVKSEKRLANLKPSYSYQYQDGKNRGPEMKKKIKKSRSIKVSDIESLRSSTLKQTISQPGKPPPLNVPTTVAATPQKQTPARTSDGSPNYMKSTSSSEARKESSQVSSSRYSQTGSDCKNLRQRSSSNTKLIPGSSSKPARSLTRSSSLKLARTLTKTPSFKPVRAGTKKCSRVVICADMNAQRATCSSTLKDSKFPDYLMLNPGATEAEGTSAVKVCPYTYCSLNGHHHTPLPPLKGFLSARRRMMRTQKSMKLEALSPHKVKPANKIVAGQVVFDDKPGFEDGDLDNSRWSPLIQEGGMNFFIEIYAKNKEHNHDEQIAENLSDGSPCSAIGFEENPEQYSDITSMGIDITEGFPVEETVENPDKCYTTIAAQTEGVSGNCYNGSDFEDESNDSSDEDDGISEASDMEWEKGQFPILEPDTPANVSVKDDNESDLDDGFLSEIVDHDLHGEPITKSDNIVITCCEKIMIDEIFQVESACPETQQGESDSDSERDQNFEIVESSKAFQSDQESSTEEAKSDLIGAMITSAWTEEPIVEPTASIEENEETNRVLEAENETIETSPQFGYVETFYTPEVTDEALMTMWLQNQISDSFQNSDETERVVTGENYDGSQETEDSKTDKKVATSGFDLDLEISNNEIGVQVPDDLFEAYQDDAEMDDNQNHNMIDTCHLDDSAENSNSGQDEVDKIHSVENQEDPPEGEYDGLNVTENQKNLENDEVRNFDIPSTMDSEEQSDSRMNTICLAESGTAEVEKMEVEDNTQSDGTETLPMTDRNTFPELETTSLPFGCKFKQELGSTCSNQKWSMRSKKAVNDEDELRNFNPREPNFLPVVADPDAEKVDLKHQMMDERKNSEEWMVDYALRQAITKLAPARKRKVALLVEAFETVIPVPKCETRLRHSSAAFASARPIQACS